MISILGVLTIRISTGRYGEFKVGRLSTSIGDFAVKAEALEQYPEGSFEGMFGISRIYPAHYAASGRMIIEVRAEVHGIALNQQQPVEQLDALLEQDPPSQQEAKVKPKPSEPSGQLSEASPLQSTLEGYQEPKVPEAGDQALFGLLWPLGSQVKLDATQDRKVLKQQRDRLDALGYQFRAVGQLWVKP